MFLDAPHRDPGLQTQFRLEKLEIVDCQSLSPLLLGYYPLVPVFN